MLLQALLVIILTSFSNTDKHNVTAHKGKNTIKFELVKNAPKYAVSHGKTEVISPSDMGFVLKGNEDLSSNFEIKGAKTFCKEENSVKYE